MRKSILAIATAAALAASAPAFASDQSILFEVGVGFGKSGSSSGKTDSKWCKHRDQAGMIMGAIRYRYNDAEIHVARWTHDEDMATCNRDSWAVGVGYVLDTQGDGEEGIDDVYASWTPGFAYTWGDNKNFKGQDAENTNWRLTGNFQVFNRFAVGAGGNDGMAEVAVHRYGSFDPDHGEYFATIGLGLRDYEKPDEVIGGGDRDINPGDGSEVTTVTHTEVLEDGTIVTTTTTTTTDVDGNVYVTNDITYNIDNSVTITDNSVTIVDNSTTNPGEAPGTGTGTQEGGR